MRIMSGVHVDYRAGKGEEILADLYKDLIFESIDAV